MTTYRTSSLARAGARVAMVLVLGVSAVSVRAQVGIRNSAHDLSASSTATVRSSDEAETCVFCHIPHRAQTTLLLWNRTYMGPSSYTWGTDLFGTPITTTAVYETQLPQQLRPESRRCLSCHDGSVSVADVAVGTDPTIPDVAGRTAGGVLTGPGKVIGFGGDLSGHHPVGVPYPGTMTYGPEALRSNVPPEKISTAKGGYWPTASGGACQSPSGSCTVATGALNVNGADINLIRNTPADTSNVGVECTSCHDPHNRYGFDYFLRVNVQYDGLCNSCHNK